MDAGIKEIYLDEVQFFHDSIVPVLLDISLQGIKVVAAGLDMDSKGEVFGPMNGLKKISQTHILLKARCQTCGLPAMYTYRKTSDENQLLIGSSDIYEARCEEHWKQ